MTDGRSSLRYPDVAITASCLAALVALVVWRPPSPDRPERPDRTTAARRAGQFHRITGVVHAATADGTGLTALPLVLVDRATAALAADGGEPPFTLVPVERRNDGAITFHRDGLAPGDYHIYCVWPGSKPTRASVLLEDDYPRDDLTLRVEASKVVAIGNDMFSADAIVEARYRGPWPKTWERVALDGQRVLLEERAPDGLPSELRVSHGGRMSRWCVARNVEPAPWRRVSEYLRPWTEGAVTAVTDAAPATALIYRCQSPRRGARIHLLSPDGGYHCEHSDVFGELTACLAPPVALAVVEGDVASKMLMSPLRPGPDTTPIPRFPTYDESLNASAILVACIPIAAGEETTAATIETLVPQRGRGRLEANGTGFVRLRNAHAVPTEVDISVVPDDHRYAPFQARLSDLVPHSWRLECDVHVHATFATITPPVGVIRVAAPPVGRIDRWVVFRHHGDVLVPLTIYQPKSQPRRKPLELVFRWLSPGKYNVRAFGDGAWQADVDVGDEDATATIQQWQQLAPSR